MSGFPRLRAVLAIALTIPFFATQASADSERVFYAFVGHAHDGFYPTGGLIADDDGNLYGTTQYGGSAHLGTVFKLTPQGSETILHSFTGNYTGGDDGATPSAALLRDETGNLYGTTAQGGHQNVGTVYRIAPDGTESTLYSFNGGSDGTAPVAELIADESGNLYGTTIAGGTNDAGTVFKLAPDGTETVLYNFGSNDDAQPQAGLWRDAKGNLYGTTFRGTVTGGGIVFKISTDGTETVLHRFTMGADGGGSSATLVPDGKGNLYGTAQFGGTGKCNGGCGVVFKIAKDDTFSVIYSFPNAKSGWYPVSRLLISNGKRKILYGTTQSGGSNRWGVVFKLTLDGKETVLHNFSRVDKTGHVSTSPLTADPSFTHLFGETARGGNAHGVVYVLKP